VKGLPPGVGVVLLGLTALTPPAQAQSLASPRSTALGAYGPLVRDTRSFIVNPAGLTALRDWDFSTTTYVSVARGDPGFVFGGFSFGRKFFDRWAVAVEYAPGMYARFVVPPILSIGGGNAPMSNDREITYEEPFTLGVAWSPAPWLSLGAGLRYRTTRVRDTEYQIVVRDTIAYPTSRETTSRASAWPVDVALLWTPVEGVAVSVTARNAFFAAETSLPNDLRALLLPRKAVGEAGVAYKPADALQFAVAAATDRYGAFGVEVGLPLGLTLRNGAVFHGGSEPFAEAVGVGIGWTRDVVDIDAAYVHFTSQGNRRGTASVSGFDASEITRIDFTPYTADRVTLSVRAMFGRVRSSLARIEGIEMLGGVYPSSVTMLAYQPLGRARVRNVSDRPIMARISFFVDNVMDGPTESPAVQIAAGATADIPFTAVFNERLRTSRTLHVRDGEVSVSAMPAEQYDDRAQTRVLIHGRNDWNGEVNALRYFVTPDDPSVLRTGRDALLAARDTLGRVPRDLEPFVSAKILFDSFAGKLVYVNDPKQSADFVQYPAETLTLRGGDCDDMTVCFASLLGGIGISTAFVDVVPPARPAEGHIYLLFDTGLAPPRGPVLTSNPKRYLLRKNRSGAETIWIPIETTVIQQGFDAAWTQGAQQYFDDAEVGLGLIKGWVRIVDVN
jgi:hypothetical protein